MKGQRGVNTERKDKVLMCDNKMLHELSLATFLSPYSTKDNSKEESTINKEIFIGLKRPGLIILDIFLFSVTSS